MIADIDSIKAYFVLESAVPNEFSACRDGLVAVRFEKYFIWRAIQHNEVFACIKFALWEGFKYSYGYHLSMRHRADRYIGFQLKPGENEIIENMAKASGLTKAELGRALLRAGASLFEDFPNEVLALAKVDL